MNSGQKIYGGVRAIEEEERVVQQEETGGQNNNNGEVRAFKEEVNEKREAYLEGRRMDRCRNTCVWRCRSRNRRIQQ